MELRVLDDHEHTPMYYTVGRYGFDPKLQINEEVWINWQIADHHFKMQAKITSRKKELYVDGKSLALNMSSAEKAKFSAIYPNGISALLEGASLYLIRFFLEAIDQDTLLKIREAIAQEGRVLQSVKQLPGIS